MAIDANELTVGEMMSPDVIGVESQATLRDALERMIAHRVSALPVIRDEHTCIGILSARDLIEMAYRFHQGIEKQDAADQVLLSLLNWDELCEALGGQSIEDVMTVGLHSLPPGASCAEAARLMVEAGVHRLPVVEPTTGHIVGIVSTTDVVRAVAQSGRPSATGSEDRQRSQKV